MKTIIRIFPVFLLFLFASPALAQSESLSEEDQVKAAIRLQFWQKTLFTRLLVRGDKALA